MLLTEEFSATSQRDDTYVYVNIGLCKHRTYLMASPHPPFTPSPFLRYITYHLYRII